MKLRNEDAPEGEVAQQRAASGTYQRISIREKAQKISICRQQR